MADNAKMSDDLNWRPDTKYGQWCTTNGPNSWRMSNAWCHTRVPSGAVFIPFPVETTKWHNRCTAEHDRRLDGWCNSNRPGKRCVQSLDRLTYTFTLDNTQLVRLPSRVTTRVYKLAGTHTYTTASQTVRRHYVRFHGHFAGRSTAVGGPVVCPVVRTLVRTFVTGTGVVCLRGMERRSHRGRERDALGIVRRNLSDAVENNARVVLRDGHVLASETTRDGC